MITKQRARRRLIAVAAIVTVVGGVVVGLAIGSGDSSPGAPSTTTTSFAGDPFEVAVAHGVIVASGNLVNLEQATCVARRLTDTLGRTELVQLGRATQEGGDLAPEVEAAVLDAMVGCVPQEALEEIGARRDD